MAILMQACRLENTIIIIINIHVLYFLFRRTPDQKYRPTFAEIFETLSGLDSNLLKWFDNDLATLSNLAMQLGAPLKEAKDMFLDLQKRNIIQEEILPYTGNLRTEV